LSVLRIANNDEYHYILFGIASGSPAYRLSHFINKALEINLGALDPSQPGPDKPAEKVLYKAAWTGKEGDKLYLLHNDNKLIPISSKFGNFNFLLIYVSQFEKSERKNILLERLNGLSIIEAIFELPVEQKLETKIKQLDQTTF